jgi:hypothetical protein
MNEMFRSFLTPFGNLLEDARGYWQHSENFVSGCQRVFAISGKLLPEYWQFFKITNISLRDAIAF